MYREGEGLKRTNHFSCVFTFSLFGKQGRANVNLFVLDTSQLEMDSSLKPQYQTTKIKSKNFSMDNLNVGR